MSLVDVLKYRFRIESDGLGKDFDKEVFDAFHVEDYGELAKSSNDQLVKAVASSVKCPEEVLVFLFNRFSHVFYSPEGVEILGTVAGNPSTPVVILLKIAKLSTFLADRVVSNGSFPVGLLWEVFEQYEDSFPSVVLAHPECPPDLVRKVFNSAAVRRNLAVRHDNCPEDVLYEFAVDVLKRNDSQTILFLLGLDTHPNCSQRVLRKIMEKAPGFLSKSPYFCEGFNESDADTFFRLLVDDNPNVDPGDIFNILKCNKGLSYEDVNLLVKSF